MKKSIADLAIFGGPKSFDETLHVGRPNIGDRARLLERFNDILDRRWLTNNGPMVQELEQRIAGYLGVRHCIAICNATVALEIAIRALGMTGEVIVPSMTFIATVHALQWQEITPVFCDIDPETHNLDPARVAELITPRTTGIIGVHLWGRPCATERLREIADRRNLRLLFDAAHAFGCSARGTMIGNFGDAEVFSFHATKFLNTFEGGAIVTNDDALAARIHLMKNFGFAGFDKVIYVGTNGKMSEISAAMGLTGLDCLDDIIAVNARNYQAYRKGLAEVPGIRLIEYPQGERNNWQYVVLELDEGQAGIGRDRMIEILAAENVLARRYFYPGCHRMEPYRTRFPEAGKHLAHTEALVSRVLSLPTGTAVSPADIAKICDLIRFIISSGDEISRALQEKAG